MEDNKILMNHNLTDYPSKVFDIVCSDKWYFISNCYIIQEDEQSYPIVYML